MVKLRLKRMGKKKSAFYRIVVADSRVQRDGKYIELLGTYDPLKKHTILNKELSLKWMFNGAQPTDTVKSILSKEGVLKMYHDERTKLRSQKAKLNPKKQKLEKKIIKNISNTSNLKKVIEDAKVS